MKGTSPSVEDLQEQADGDASVSDDKPAHTELNIRPASH